MTRNPWAARQQECLQSSTQSEGRYARAVLVSQQLYSAVAALKCNVGRRQALAGCFSGAVGLDGKHTHTTPSRGAATGAADELYELVRTRRPSQWQDSERARIVRSSQKS